MWNHNFRSRTSAWAALWQWSNVCFFLSLRCKDLLLNWHHIISVLKIIFKVSCLKKKFIFSLLTNFLSLPGYEMLCPSLIHLAKGLLLLGTHHLLHSIKMLQQQMKTPTSNPDLSDMLSWSQCWGYKPQEHLGARRYGNLNIHRFLLSLKLIKISL